MSVETIAAFRVVSFLMLITPGIDWTYAIAAGLRHQSVPPAVSGLVSGHLLVVAAVATLGGLVAKVPAALAVLTVIGATYFIWVGVMTLRHPAAPISGDMAVSTSPRQQFLKGFGVSGLNVKLYLVMLALLPQFTNPSPRTPVAVQLSVLGLIHVANCAVIYGGVAVAAKRVLQARPAAARAATLISGVVLVAVGAVLLVEQVMHIWG
ncbi:MAG: LysE family translocator [Thermomicrobiales bacterium]